MLLSVSLSERSVLVVSLTCLSCLKSSTPCMPCTAPLISPILLWSPLMVMETLHTRPPYEPSGYPTRVNWCEQMCLWNKEDLQGLFLLTLPTLKLTLPLEIQLSARVLDAGQSPSLDALACRVGLPWERRSWHHMGLRAPSSSEMQGPDRWWSRRT